MPLAQRPFTVIPESSGKFLKSPGSSSLGGAAANAFNAATGTSLL